MKHVLFTIILSLTITTLSGQENWQKECFHPEDIGYGVMIENTKILNPGVYQYMQERVKLGKFSFRNDTLGTRRDFFVSNDVTDAFDTVNFELKHIGNKVRIWVSVAEWNNNHVNPNVVNQLSQNLEQSTPPNSLDPSKGIVDLINQYFGNFPDYDGDGLTDFLVCDIQDGWTPGKGYKAGFFYSIDQTTKPGSNQADILYLDSFPSIADTAGNLRTNLVLKTSAHELQHLVHFNYDENEIRFVNEGLSEISEVVCGYNLRSTVRYFNNLNVPLLTWETVSGSTLIDYSRAALFTYYYYELFGESILKDIVQNTKVGEAGLNEEIKKRNAALDLRQLFRNFCYANYIQDKNVAVNYGYSSAINGKPELTFDIMYPNTYTSSKSLKHYAVSYALVKTDNFNDSLNSNFMATEGGAFFIKYPSGSDPYVEIMDLNTIQTITNFKMDYDSLVYVHFNFNESSESNYSIAIEGDDPNLYWNQIPLTAGNAFDMWSFDNGFILASVGFNEELIISKDGGSSFAYYPTPGGVYDVFYHSSTKKYFLGTDAGVFSTDSSFLNFTQIGNLNDVAYHIIIDKSGNIFAGTSFSGIYKASLNNQNWSSFNDGLEGGVTGIFSDGFAANKAGEVFAFIHYIENGDVYSQIYKFSGSSWTLIDEIYNEGIDSHIDGVGDNIFVSYGGTLYKYPGDDTPWTESDLPLFHAPDYLSINPNDSTEMFAATFKGVYHSNDQGITWTKRNNGFFYENDEIISSIVHTKNGDIIASSDWIMYKYNNTTTGIRNQPVENDFWLSNNYPNPFNPTTTIEYTVAKPGKVSITIFDILGRKVDKIVNEFKQAGNYKLLFDASNLSSGVYFYQLQANDFVKTKKMLLIK